MAVLYVGGVAALAISSKTRWLPRAISIGMLSRIAGAVRLLDHSGDGEATPIRGGPAHDGSGRHAPGLATAGHPRNG